MKKILTTLIFASTTVCGMSPNISMDEMRLKRLQRFDISNTSGANLQQNEIRELDTSKFDGPSLRRLIDRGDKELENLTKIKLDLRPFAESGPLFYNFDGFDCPELKELIVVNSKNPPRNAFEACGYLDPRILKRQIVLGTYKQAKQLETFDVSDNGWDCEDITSFLQVCSWGSLSVKVMNLQKNKIKSVPRVMTACPNLEVLNLNYNNGDDSCIAKNVKHLCTDIVSAIENEGNFPKLRELHIAGMNLGRSEDKMWNLPEKLELIEMDKKWLKCISENRLAQVDSSVDGETVTVHLK